MLSEQHHSWENVTQGDGVDIDDVAESCHFNFFVVVIRQSWCGHWKFTKIKKDDEHRARGHQSSLPRRNGHLVAFFTIMLMEKYYSSSLLA